jgi:hypothetical protein
MTRLGSEPSKHRSAVSSSQSRPGRRLRNLSILVGFTLSMLALATAAEAFAGGSEDVARVARTVDGADVAHLHLVRQREGEVLYEEGVATGSLPGHMRAELRVQPTVLTGRCTITTRDGSITGEGHATPHGAGRYQSFRGTLLITKGTGRYKGIHGRAGLYGTFDRRTFALVVQTTGTLSY